MRRLSTVLLCALLIFTAGFANAEEKKFKLLFVTQSKGFQHGSVKRPGAAGVLAPSEQAVIEIGTRTGLFTAECTQDASEITPEKLKNVDVLMFYTTGKLPITPENFTALQDWLKSGKAFVGTHSATDTFGDFKPYYELINGTFDGHPWGSGTNVTMTNHEPEHPAMKMFPAEFVFKDEIYQYKNYDPKAVRVLLSINMAKTQPKMPYLVPISWVREYGQGRLFYTNLGHNEGTWKDTRFQEHLLQGIRWALKMENGSATPNPELQAKEDEKARMVVMEEFKNLLPPVVAGTGTDQQKINTAVAELANTDSKAFSRAWERMQGLKGEKNAEKQKDGQTRLVAQVVMEGFKLSLPGVKGDWSYWQGWLLKDFKASLSSMAANIGAEEPKLHAAAETLVKGDTKVFIRAYERIHSLKGEKDPAKLKDGQTKFVSEILKTK